MRNSGGAQMTADPPTAYWSDLVAAFSGEDSSPPKPPAAASSARPFGAQLGEEGGDGVERLEARVAEGQLLSASQIQTLRDAVEATPSATPHSGDGGGGGAADGGLQSTTSLLSCSGCPT
eukprot:scaffold3741_cov22-Phaeocystis_antarctica.AAC.1